MKNFQYQLVWQTQVETLRQEITGFWTKEGAMANSEAFESGAQRKNIGLMMDVQDPAHQKKHIKAIWPESGMVYVGKTAQGAHQRVVYFSDAQIA